MNFKLYKSIKKRPNFQKIIKEKTFIKIRKINFLDQNRSSLTSFEPEEGISKLRFQFIVDTNYQIFVQSDFRLYKLLFCMFFRICQSKLISRKMSSFEN